MTIYPLSCLRLYKYPLCFVSRPSICLILYPHHITLEKPRIYPLNSHLFTQNHRNPNPTSPSMTNKRVTRREKPSGKTDNKQEGKLPSSMEDTAEKLESLKSLNSLLLKETVERRQQVDSLLKSKAALETEVSISAHENRRLEDELTGLSSELSFLNDKYASLDVERSLSYVFLATQFNQEMQRLTSCILEEKKEMRAHYEQLHVDILKDKRSAEKELADFRLAVNSLEKNIAQLTKENESLRMENVGLGREKNGMERRQEVLEREILGLAREKGEIEKSAANKAAEISSLKSLVDDLNVRIHDGTDAFSCVRKERDEMSNKIVEMGKKVVLLEEKLQDMTLKNEEMMVQKAERERTIEELRKDRHSAVEKLSESLRVVEELRREIDVTVHEKKRREKEREEQMQIFNGLQGELSEANEKISFLQNEKDELLYKVEKIQTAFKALEVETRVGERRYETLLHEKTLVAKRLEEAEEANKDLSFRLEVTKDISDQVFTMLKNTTLLVSKAESNGNEHTSFVHQNKVVEELKPYEAELISIKSAFESREHKVAEMERQVECMKNSVREANKQKTFWTLFSSATTIFAAASVAYFRLTQ